MTVGPTDARNRLGAVRSAYLRQHAGNPVPWWPWGQGAIADARRRDVPLLVSVGYSTCHWCHVMERECFEDPGIAARMGELFTCVKVDREERPDLDAIWMQACQVFTALTEGRPSGGWPLHVFLEPRTLQPFFAGTYFPPVPAHGRVSFPELLQQLALAWRDRREKVEAQAAELGRLIRAEMRLSTDRRPLDEGVERLAAQALIGFHDRVHGGFGGAPKFPQPSLLRFLQARRADPAADDVVHRSLERMAMGGVRDQLDGGFHRYAVDATWTVPHFEKMLYDQGQLLTLYASAASGDPFLRRVAGELADFLVGVMREPGGAFAAALDADAGGREGGAHVWTPAEVETALREGACEAHGPMAMQAFGLDRSANFRDPHHPEDAPAWVLTLEARPEVLAARAGCFEAPWWQALARVRSAMLAARAMRPQPFRDTAIIAAWNGLAIEGLAEAGVSLERPELVAAASDAAHFVLRSLRMPEGGLARSWRDGDVSGPAYLEDHGCLAMGLLALHRSTGDATWREAAGNLLQDAWRRCWSEEDGWVEAAADEAGRFTHVGGVDDGAMPSGAGAVTLAMVMLAAQGGDAVCAERAHAALERASGEVAGRPTSSPMSLLAAQALRDGWPERVPGGRRAGPVRVELVAVDREGDRFELRLGIAPGHHVPAEPGASSIEVQPRDTGVRIALDWPEPRVQDGVRGHRGEVVVPIRLIMPRPAPRPLRLLVQWRCCQDGPAGVCLAPEQALVEG
ncbi:MAG: DUF255 domain-containing protein [Planctomycetes bacterium]|nr:DUF255 domain-containing protein [Planctomycetota bacterium]